MIQSTESGLEVQLSEGPFRDTENDRNALVPSSGVTGRLYTGRLAPRVQRAGFWTQFTTARGPGPQMWVYLLWPPALGSAQVRQGLEGPIRGYFAVISGIPKVYCPSRQNTDIGACGLS